LKPANVKFCREFGIDVPLVDSLVLEASLQFFGFVWRNVHVQC